MRRARELAGLDLTGGSRAIGIGRGELRSVERGRRVVSTAVLERAIEVYGSDGLALPPRRDLVHPSDPTLLVIGDETVRLDPGRADDREVLAAYVAAVRRQRGLLPDEEVPFRSHDLVALARVLDLSAVDLEQQLSSAARLATDRARRAARSLVLTGLSFVAVGATPSPGTDADSSWLARGTVGASAPTERPSCLDELEGLMADLRSAT